MKQGLKENKDNLAQVEVEVDLCKMKVLDFLNSTRWVHNANTKITMIELSYYYSIVTKYNEQAGAQSRPRQLDCNYKFNQMDIRLKLSSSRK